MGSSEHVNIRKRKETITEIERWNTEPKQFNRMCNLLPGKQKKNSYSLSKVVLRDMMATT